MTGNLPWYVARSAGLLAWVLLTASVLWGLALSGKAKAFGRRPRPNWTLDLHRFLGGLASTTEALVAQAANVATFGTLWLVQFVLLDRVLFNGDRTTARAAA